MNKENICKIAINEKLKEVKTTKSKKKSIKNSLSKKKSIKTINKKIKSQKKNIVKNISEKKTKEKNEIEIEFQKINKKEKKLTKIINQNLEYFSHVGRTCECNDCTCGKCKCENSKTKKMINHKDTYKTSNQMDFIYREPILNNPIKYHKLPRKAKKINLISKSRSDYKFKKLPKMNFEKIFKGYFFILNNINDGIKKSKYNEEFKNTFEKRVPDINFKPKRYSSVVKLPYIKRALKNSKLQTKILTHKKRNSINPSQKYKNPLGPFGNLFDSSSYQNEFKKNDINKYFEKKNLNSIHKKIHTFSFKGKFNTSSKIYGSFKEKKCPVFYKKNKNSFVKKQRKSFFHKLSILN